MEGVSDNRAERRDKGIVRQHIVHGGSTYCARVCMEDAAISQVNLSAIVHNCVHCHIRARLWPWTLAAVSRVGLCLVVFQ